MSPEFSRPVRIDTIGSVPNSLTIEADAAERQALAERFGLEAIASLSAELTVTRDGAALTAQGSLRAAVTQICIASAVPVPARVEEAFTILFHPQPEHAPDAEMELGEGELDVVFYDGAAIDVGEAVAETLSLGLDPYPRSPEAEAALKAAGVKSEAEAEVERIAKSPFAALKKN